MSSPPAGAVPPPGDVEDAGRRRRRALRLLAVSAVVAVLGAVLAGITLGGAFRNLIVLDRDLLVRVDAESVDTVDLDEADYVLVAVGHGMTDRSSGSRPNAPGVRITGPDGTIVPLRTPGYDSQTTTGEQRVVVADLTVTAPGDHVMEVGPSPTLGLESMAIAPKQAISSGRIIAGIIGVGLFVLAGLGVLISGLIAILAHRDVRRSRSAG